MADRSDITDAELNAAIRRGDADAGAAGAVAEPEPARVPIPFPVESDWMPAGGWPDREWLIRDWLPVGRFGLVSGPGESGKSWLMLQLAAAVAAPGGSSVPFVGGPASIVADVLPGVEAEYCGPVVWASWEDEHPEVGRRLAALAAAGLAAPADLGGRLLFADVRGAGPLWAPGWADGELVSGAGGRHLANAAGLTEVGADLRKRCEADGARLLVIDNLAGAYASDENARALVRAFVADWDRWGSETGCTVAVISHPPKPASGAGAAAVERDYSGSTDWHAAARWRWTLTTEPTGAKWADRAGPAAEVKAPRLRLAKSNYRPSRDDRALWLAPVKSGGGKGFGWRAVSADEAADVEANLKRRKLAADSNGANGAAKRSGGGSGKTKADADGRS